MDKTPNPAKKGEYFYLLPKMGSRPDSFILFHSSFKPEKKILFLKDRRFKIKIEV